MREEGGQGGLTSFGEVFPSPACCLGDRETTEAVVGRGEWSVSARGKARQSTEGGERTKDAGFVAKTEKEKAQVRKGPSH